MFQLSPPALLIVTLITSPGVTVQLASPVQPEIGVSLAGRISYHALYCGPNTSLLGNEFSDAPAWIRSLVLYPPIPVQVAAKPGGTRPADGTTNVDETAVIPSLVGVTA